MSMHEHSREPEMTMEDLFLDPNDPDDVAFWESTTPEISAEPYDYRDEIMPADAVDNSSEL